MNRSNRREVVSAIWPPVYYAGLAIAVWAPALFSGGFVLLGDMVFTPAMNPNVSLLGPPRGLMSVALLLNIAWGLSRLIGAVALQKLLLVSLVFLPGYVMYRNAPTPSRPAAVFAGTLYAVNPFIYTRLVMGQWGLILGYALLPVALMSALKTFKEPSGRACVKTSLWLALVAVLNVNMGIIALLLALLICLFSHGRLVRPGRMLGALGVVLALFLLLCSFFIVPALHSGELTSRVGRADLEAFETRSSSAVGEEVSVLGLYGFWKLQLDSILPRRHVPLWWLFAALLLVLSVLGASRAMGEPTRGPLVKALVVCAVLGFFLALGSRAPLTGRLFLFLYDHSSVMKLFREPQKFVAILVLAYSMLGAIGVERLLGRRSRKPVSRPSWKAVFVAVLLLLTLFYSFRVFGGLWGEARAVEYPSSWTEAKQVLDREAGDARVLFVPPYWYMRFDFTGGDRTIASPFPTFFEQRNVVAVAIEVFGRQLNAGPLDRYLEAAFASARDEGNLGATLALLDVKYVVFARNPASSLFSYVLEQEDMEVIKSWPDLVLLENKVPASRLMLAGREGAYRDLASAARAAEWDNLAGSYIRKGAQTEIADATGKALDYRGGSRGASFELPAGSGPGDSVLLAEPYDGDWRMEGRAALPQLGTTCAFPVAAGAEGRNAIRYVNPFITAGYALSGLGLALCVLFFLVARPGNKAPSPRR